MPLAPWKGLPYVTKYSSKSPSFKKLWPSNIKVDSYKWVIQFYFVFVRLPLTVTCLILKNYKPFLQRNGLLKKKILLKKEMEFWFFANFWVASFSPPVVHLSLVSNVFPANAMVGRVSTMWYLYMLYNPFALLVILKYWM